MKVVDKVDNERNVTVFVDSMLTALKEMQYVDDIVIAGNLMHIFCAAVRSPKKTLQEQVIYMLNTYGITKHE